MSAAAAAKAGRRSHDSFGRCRTDPLLVLSFQAAHATLDRFVFGDLRGEAVDGLQAYFHHAMYWPAL